MVGQPDQSAPVPDPTELVTDSVISRPLQELMESSKGEPIGVVIELRVAHPGGIVGARERLTVLIERLTGSAKAARVIGSYISVRLTTRQIRALVRADAADERREEAIEPTDPVPADAAGSAPRWSIHRIWPDFTVNALIHRSIVTTKCVAAHRAFNALGQDIVWAVLDSGIDATHPHFAMHGNLDLPAPLAHRSFVDTDDKDSTKDQAGHGTHVAGILAGEQVTGADRPLVAATWYQTEHGGTKCEPLRLTAICGMAPRCKLLSGKILRPDGSGDLSAVLAALQYIQELNDYGRELLVHGVNLSVGYPFDPSWFATGLSPVCREVDRLVQSGVVVVVAAGNTGFGYAVNGDGKRMRMPFDLTINDPGNAEHAITVGSTSSRPHASGVSYFSSKGPTGDGRLKPDLVAPGERVVSAGTGTLLERAKVAERDVTYVESSGTSMAAPHVSGVAAGFMSVHREFIGRPDRVKQALLDSSTDLGRAREFQGRGLVDAMRAIQTV